MAVRPRSAAVRGNGGPLHGSYGAVLRAALVVKKELAACGVLDSDESAAVASGAPLPLPSFLKEMCRSSGNDCFGTTRRRQLCPPMHQRPAATSVPPPPAAWLDAFAHTAAATLDDDAASDAAASVPLRDEPPKASAAEVADPQTAAGGKLQARGDAGSPRLGCAPAARRGAVKWLSTRPRPLCTAAAAAERLPPESPPVCHVEREANLRVVKRLADFDERWRSSQRKEKKRHEIGFSLPLAFRVAKWSSQCSPHPAVSLKNLTGRWEAAFSGSEVTNEYVVFELQGSPNTVCSIQFGVPGGSANPRACRVQYAMDSPDGPWTEAWRFEVDKDARGTLQETHEYGQLVRKFRDRLMKYCSGSLEAAHRLLNVHSQGWFDERDLTSVVEKVNGVGHSDRQVMVSMRRYTGRLFSEMDITNRGYARVADVLSEEGPPPPVAPWWRLLVLSTWSHVASVTICAPVNLLAPQFQDQAADSTVDLDSLNMLHSLWSPHGDAAGGASKGGGREHQRRRSSATGHRIAPLRRGSVGNGACARRGSSCPAGAEERRPQPAHPHAPIFAASRNGADGHGASADRTVPSTAKEVAQISVRQGVAPALGKRFYEVFKKFDTDGNMTLSSDEFKRFLDALHGTKSVEISAERADYFMRLADVDRSGSVTFEEFLSWGQQRHNRTSTCRGKHLEDMALL
eukprot:TRINITY_DN9315_c0_g1_i1.p1 TRINITY_DN9315_c0_g1~~TRINITY_DN9315_c0_g1_i1.p1  ORF type:complete len:714 (+),score=120.67 TRINITY_DN9315_c0_g1_i1:87-2144(+)